MDVKEIIVLISPDSETKAENTLDKKKGLYKKVIGAVEKPLLEDVLSKTKGNQLKAARILGINRNTMRAKIKKLGIDPKVYRQ